MSILDLPSVNVAKPSGASTAPNQSDTAAFTTHWVRPSTAVVTVSGELDAANVQQFTTYVVAHLNASSRLILNLKRVDFFAISCFPVLHNVNLRCMRENVYWTLLPGTATARVLRVCDPEGLLPTSSSLAAAFSRHRNTA